LKNQCSLKKISRNSSGKRLWDSILIHQFTEIFVFNLCIWSAKYLMTNLWVLTVLEKLQLSIREDV
jgi:hypothetical protein